MLARFLFLLLTLTAAASAGEGDGLFVAVGYGGRRISSRDGEHWENDQRWSETKAESDDALFDVAYGLGRFVAVGGGSQTGHLLATSDGKSWHSLQDVKGRVATIAFGRGRFIAAHDAELMVSTDGEHFQNGARLDWPGNVRARRSACGDTEAGFRTVVIGDIELPTDKKSVAWRGVTGDGSEWESAARDTPAARDVAYGSGHFVVVGPGGLIESSHDGQSWERQASDAGADFTRVVWTGARFFAQAGNAIWTSPDGLTWTQSDLHIPCTLAWARERLALSVSADGRIHVGAPFGIWKPATAPVGPALQAVAFAPR